MFSVAAAQSWTQIRDAFLQRGVAANQDDDRRLQNDMRGEVSFGNSLSRGRIVDHHEMPGTLVPFRMGGHC